ncbi:hypothetical protein GMA8713_03305 [Grimontia marina]|uniref:Uncharacterized protein n=1 Tax=Grimontia marina TaxID=646534 RepID=A0A128FF09_9GAMM|nr:hypothetical protein GMA8713_03305 [Grimontia marina]
MAPFYVLYTVQDLSDLLFATVGDSVLFAFCKSFRSHNKTLSPEILTCQFYVKISN